MAYPALFYILRLALNMTVTRRYRQPEIGSADGLESGVLVVLRVRLRERERAAWFRDITVRGVKSWTARSCWSSGMHSIRSWTAH